MNHEKDVTLEEVFTSTSLYIHNILLHGIFLLCHYIIERQFYFFQIFFYCVIILLIDYVVKFPCVQ
jgi:hypothetical protein